MRRCKNKISGEVCEYFVYGIYPTPAWFKGTMANMGDYIVKSGFGVIDRCGSCEVFSEEYNVLERITESDSVESLPVSDIDASFVGDTLELPSGRKCKWKCDNKMFDLFIYGKDESPKWFNYESLNEKQKDYLIRHGIGYVVNELYEKDKVFIFGADPFVECMEEIVDANAKYGSIERNFDDGECVIGGGKSAAMVCRCRNDHSVVHEYFVYGVDDTPEWANMRMSKASFLNLAKGDFVVMRGDSGIVFVMDQDNFIKNLEVCGTDVEVGVLSKEQIDDYSKDFSVIKNAPISESVAAGTKVHTDNWQQGLGEYVKKSDVSDIDRAELWFNNLHPEVFRHIVLHAMDGDGMVNMVKLYKSESNAQ